MKTIFRIAFRLPLVTAVFMLSGCAAKGAGHAPDHSDQYDQQFLTSTLEHLDGDLRIARTCKGKRIRPELAAFCADLYNDQSREHARMAAWLTDWYQKDPPSDTLRLWIESQDGETFERYFIKGVLEGHREIAERADGCTRHAKHQELAEVCKEVAAHRSEEAKQLEQWNCQWFGQCSQ